MKRLDEVIEELNIWDAYDHEYPDVFYDTQTIRDALYYLREYRRNKQIYSYDIARRFFELAERNAPLTWDELKQMEGKPVWYEHEFWKGWIILGKVEQGVNCEMIPDREERWYIVKDGIAKAYRKERE